MPMKGNALLRPKDFVVHGNLNSIAPIGFNLRSRELAVDQNNAFLVSIGGDHAAFGSEIVESGDTGIWSASVRVGAIGGSVAPWVAIVVGATVRDTIPMAI